MGYPYHELVPAAVLFSNPSGLTRGEFVERLEEIKVSPFTVFKKEDPWDKYNENGLWANCFQGLEGLAKALKLRESFKYEVFQVPVLDSKGLFLLPPLIVHPPRVDSYLVFSHLLNDLGNSIMPNTKDGIHELGKNILFDLRHQLNNIVDDSFCIKNEAVLPCFVDEGKISCQFEVQKYDSMEELYLDHPQFHPTNRYNFNQPWGNFYLLCGEENFWWRNKGGKYFLDPKTYDCIPASWQSSNFRSYGFSDLVITSLAIEHSAWKLLSRRGLDHLDDFFNDFPEAKETFEGAVRDAQTFGYSAENEETYFEAMRRRLSPSGSGKERI